jgi:hypothetical protein
MEITKIKRQLKSIASINTDWYQWGLNCQILEYNKDVTDHIAQSGRLHYKGSVEDLDLFWEGYYSEIMPGFDIFSSRNGAMSKDLKRKMFAYGCDGKHHAVWTATEWLDENGDTTYAEDHGIRVICKCNGRCKDKFLTKDGKSKGGFLIV